MPAGKYRDRIEVQRNRPTTDAAGQSVDDWHPFCRRWANIRGTGGKEQQRGQAVRDTHCTHVVLVRYDRQSKNIRSSMRIVWDGIVLNIESALRKNGQRKEIQLLCTEVQ